MNWQTREILKEAEKCVSDEGVFSPDQIGRLIDMVRTIARALDKEADCNKSSIDYDFYHY